MSELPIIQNRIAVIDCGTNTFNLLVADPTEGGWHTIYQTKLSVKIGEGSFESRRIQPARFARGLDALLSYKYTCSNYECNRIYAYGTSALRDSLNGAEFVEQAKKILGTAIHLIDGSEEAQLIYEGVRLTYTPQNESVLIMDIGGGSTEFVIANEEGVQWKASYQLGVSRLYDTIKPSDPMQRSEMLHLREYLEEALVDLKAALAQYQPQHLIGSSGSFDTLLDLYFAAIKKDKASREGLQRIPIPAMRNMNDQLMMSTYDQRLKNPAIPEMRAQFMPLASALVDHVLQLHTFTEIIHSPNSLKEGAMHRMLQMS